MYLPTIRYAARRCQAAAVRARRYVARVRKAGPVLALIVTLMVGTAVALPTPAGASGPALSVPRSGLVAALRCHGDLAAGPRPVLLAPGTTLTPDVNFSWNYEAVFSAAGRPWCAVTIPEHGMGDVSRRRLEGLLSVERIS
jgi:hypothetical protein